MIGAIAHRGPDGDGFLCEDAIGLAHARLSIIDIAGGRQPIHNEDESVWVVFNGEIFNYIELRAELEQAGHRFYTQSDTEVIVHLYEAHGEDFVSHLNGQFAIALWDRRRRQLVLARDRTGIRPLFHTTVNGRLCFASEAKALFALPEVPRRIAPRALAEIFTFWAPLEPHCIFEGVESLPPGHVMVVTDDATRLKRYWDWDFPSGEVDDRRSGEECADELRTLLIDAVRLQLRADVPVGAYLSGGLDSSIVTSLIHHFTDTPLRTFSVTFDDEEFDESAYQQQMVNYLGTTHSQIRCTSADIAAAFPRAIWHAESPILRTAPTPLLMLSGLVRQQGYKVVLTGEGADEVFGGYDLFKEAKVRRFMARAPQSTSRPRLLSRLYPYLKHSPATSGAFAKAFFSEGMAHIDKPYYGHIPRWATTARTAQFFSAGLRESLRGFDAHAELAATLPAAIGDWPPLGRDQYIEAPHLDVRVSVVLAGRPHGDGEFDRRTLPVSRSSIDRVRQPPAFALQAHGPDGEVPAQAQHEGLAPRRGATAQQAALPRARQPELLHGWASGRLCGGVAQPRTGCRSGPLRPSCGQQADREVPQRACDRFCRQHGVRRHPVHHVRR